MWYIWFMKKTAILLSLFLVAGAVFGQEYTFNGLPWGSSREQVIEKMGNPATRYGDMLSYPVSLIGYTARLDIQFENYGMIYASYNVGWYRDMNVSQLSNAFLALSNQIESKYGPYNEIIAAYNLNGIQEGERFTVWHFNNFHVIIASIDDNNTFHISYFSNIAWNNFEEIIKAGRFLRIPNNNL